MLHLIWQLNNTQQSWPFFLETPSLLDFHKSKLSWFFSYLSGNSGLLCGVFSYLSGNTFFYQFFWTFFIHIQASNLSCSWAPHSYSLLKIFICLSHLCLRLNYFSSKPAFLCSIPRVTTIYWVVQARKSSVWYHFYHLNIS